MGFATCPGSIGGGVLRACLEDPSVDSIVALSRRSLPYDNPKLKTIVHSDFTSYTEEIMQEALECDGAIWHVEVYIVKSNSILTQHV